MGTREDASRFHYPDPHLTFHRRTNDTHLGSIFSIQKKHHSVLSLRCVDTLCVSVSSRKRDHTGTLRYARGLGGRLRRITFGHAHHTVRPLRPLRRITLFDELRRQETDERTQPKASE